MTAFYEPMIFPTSGDLTSQHVTDSIDTKTYTHLRDTKGKVHELMGWTNPTSIPVKAGPLINRIKHDRVESLERMTTTITQAA